MTIQIAIVMASVLHFGGGRRWSSLHVAAVVAFSHSRWLCFCALGRFSRFYLQLFFVFSLDVSPFLCMYRICDCCPDLAALALHNVVGGTYGLSSGVWHLWDVYYEMVLSVLVEQASFVWASFWKGFPLLTQMMRGWCDGR